MNSMESSSMPMRTGPREPLREGLSTHKDQCHSSHPVEKIMEKSDTSARTSLQENVYGSALAARAAIEQQVLNRVERLPGFPSSKLGLESLTGELDTFDFGSYLPPVEENLHVLQEPHSKMERKMGM